MKRHYKDIRYVYLFVTVAGENRCSTEAARTAAAAAARSATTLCRTAGTSAAAAATESTAFSRLVAAESGHEKTATIAATAAGCPVGGATKTGIVLYAVRCAAAKLAHSINAFR